MLGTRYFCQISFKLEFSWTDFRKILKYQISWIFFQLEPSCSMPTDTTKQRTVFAILLTRLKMTLILSDMPCLVVQTKRLLDVVPQRLHRHHIRPITWSLCILTTQWRYTTYRAAIAQSIYRLPTGWTAQGSNPVVARISTPLQTGLGAHRASCETGTGFLSRASSSRGVALTTHPYLVTRLKKE